MGFLSGLGQAFQNYGLSDRLALAQAYMSGDPSQVAALRAHQQEAAIRQSELQLRQQAAQRAEEDARNQVWGMKESGHFDNAAIAAMNPDDRSHAMAGFVAPYDQAPGNRRVFPGSNGQPDHIVTAPTTDAQNAAFYDSQQPGAGAAYVNRQAYGPPVPIQQGGGLAVPGPQGWGWGVAPEGANATPQTQPSPSGGPTARNNPGGLRVPGSMQFQTFPTAQAGIAAQERLLGRPQYLGTPHSVADIVERYAPRRSRGGDNTDEQVNNYIARVAGQLGVDPHQPLSAADVPRVAAAMRVVETGRRAPGATVGAPRGAGQAAALRAEAQRAIAAGADPAAVNARLRALGVN